MYILTIIGENFYAFVNYTFIMLAYNILISMFVYIILISGYWKSPVSIFVKDIF